MSGMARRFEILLPLHFNDGTPIPEACVAETLHDLETEFGANSCETQTIRGRWHSEGHPYRDDLIRVFVDVPDTPENRQFFVTYKPLLKARFRQLDIWMTTFLMEVL